MAERDVDLDTLRKRIEAIEAGVNKREVEPDDERTTRRGGLQRRSPLRRSPPRRNTRSE